MAVRDRILRRVRPGTPSPAQPGSPSSRAPWWARVFVKGGQPLAVVVVMVMCAPGEHHLARLAGWDDRLAWGMAALLAGYAGMAAYLAGERKKGQPGHRTAVAGAVLALLLAMAAQPVSHLFVTGWFSAEPRTPVLLVIVVSCVPAPVLGHILHLAATGTRTEPAEPTEPLQTVTKTSDVPSGEQPEQAEQHGEQPEDAPEPTEPTRFLTTREVADRYGVKTSTVGTWKDRGKITPALVDPTLGNLYDPETLPPLATAG